jgi:hypothetical protein
VVHQDIVLGPALPKLVRTYTDAGRPLRVVVLCPSPAVVAAREAGRDKVGYRGIAVADLDRALREGTPRIGLWVDSSAWTPAQTAEHILARLEAARV